MHASSVSLPLAMLIVFGSAKLAAEVFERLHMPGIAGEILAGAIIGPSMLGWIAPNEVLKALSDLGVLFLLFSIGLQVKISELVRVGLTATLVATLGELLPFFAGWGILIAWGASNKEALFAGAALVATSVAISASALAARGLLHESTSKIILAAAVIDDVLGLIVLAVVSSVARGRIRILEISLTALLAAAFTVVTALWGTKVLRHLFRHFGSRGRADEAQFHIAIVVLFALSVLALYAGVAGIVGAFLAGLALADTADGRVRHLTRGASEFLVPFFLVGIGLEFDISVFRSKSVVLLALLILAAAVATKLIGCGSAVLAHGWKAVFRVGFGMVPRGEVAMVVAQMGLSLSIVSSSVYSVIVFMVVASALLTPLLLRLAHGRAAERVVVQEVV
jgi:Kef-type K+ transport system membrane component KefB